MIRSLCGRVLALILGTFAGFAGAALADTASAVNRAGEQRMLTQRIVKSYSQVGLNVMPSVATAQMSAAMSRFEANLATLESIASAQPNAASAYKRLIADWQAMRKAAAAPVSRDAALTLARRGDEVLAAAERLTRWLERSAHEGDRIVNVAGRQRMLSQRIAKAYMLLSWGIDSRTLRNELDQASREFAGGLVTLRNHPGNTDEIRGEIDGLAQQWEWLQAALQTEGAVSYRLIVVESADAILELADHLTLLYDQLDRR